MADQVERITDFAADTRASVSACCQGVNGRKQFCAVYAVPAYAEGALTRALLAEGWRFIVRGKRGRWLCPDCVASCAQRGGECGEQW